MKAPVLILALAVLPHLCALGQGTIKATTRMRPDGSMLTTVTNPDTRTKEETITDGGGKVLRKTIYFLNDQNFARAATHLDGKGAIRYKEAYKFDYSGRILESKLYTADNRPLGRRVFRYEGKNEARIEDYDANGVLITQAGRARGAPPEVRRAVPVK